MGPLLTASARHAAHAFWTILRIRGPKSPKNQLYEPPWCATGCMKWRMQISEILSESEYARQFLAYHIV
jgi:hypothetical protein